MNRKILRLAIPNIISNITVPLVGMFDTGLVGHLGSDKYIGAVALGGMIFSFVYWGFSFLRMGTTGFTAQAYGKKNKSETSRLLGQSLFIGAIGALLIMLLQVPVEKLSFSIVSGGEEVENLARQYFYVRVWAAPATIGLYSFMGWFIGMQNARIPMIISIAINILNILFSATFIYLFDMDVEGVALGTVLAQYIGLLMAIFFLFKRFGNVFRFTTFKEIVNIKAIVLFMRVGRDIFIRTMCLLFVLSFITAKSAAIGDSVLAVNTVLLQFFTLFSYITDGFAYAGEALTGLYIGERNRRYLERVVRRIFLFGAVISIMFSAIYATGLRELMLVMTSETSVIYLAETYRWWIVAIPVVSFASFLWDGIYVGATASVGMRNSMLVASLMFFAIYYVLIQFIENHAIWAAFVVFLGMRGVMQTLLANRSVYSKADIV
jgi:MATE family multidrug resistance protein